MVDKDQPADRDGEPKSKGLLSIGSKVPMDGILLVVVPFVAFVLLFLYAMGYLPADPVVILVEGAKAAEEQASDTVAQAVETEPAEEPAQVAEKEDAGPEETGIAGPTEVPEVTGGSVPGPAAGGPQDQTAAGGGAGEHAATELERTKKVKQLAKVYEQMNAASVAAIVTSLSDADAIAILSEMKPRNAAKVLASLEPERAAALSLGLAEGGGEKGE
jgi:hypothetical protein